MNDILRLARYLDQCAELEALTMRSESLAGHDASAHWYRGKAMGLRLAADMARHMHADNRQTHDVAAGDVSGG